MTRAIVARAPARLDFGGGWTDVPPYPLRDGGAVCNIAITRYATARASTDAPHDIRDPLIAASLRRSPLPRAHAELSSDFPTGAGLGGSSAAGVALAGALAELAGTPPEPAALAALSRATEVEELGIAGGYQDHYAAAFGGALLLSFGQEVAVERLPLPSALCQALARRAILVYTGESRISAETIIAVRDAYVAGSPRVVFALRRMKELAVEMAAALRAADIDALAAAVNEHWVHQRALHPRITTNTIDSIVGAGSSAGSLGTKALGASGGGCVLAIAADGREDELALALVPFGRRLSFEIDTAGFTVIHRDEHP